MDFRNLTLLTLGGFDSLTLQLEDRFLSLDVLFLKSLFSLAGKMILFDFLLRRQLRYFLDSLGVQDVVWIEQFESRLFEIVDCAVIEPVAVQVGTDHFQNFVFELVPFVVQFNEFELLSNGLQCL